MFPMSDEVIKRQRLIEAIAAAVGVAHAGGAARAADGRGRRAASLKEDA